MISLPGWCAVHFPVHFLTTQFYTDDTGSAKSIWPMDTKDGPAASASRIPPMSASPQQQQPMELSVGGGQPARPPTRRPARRAAMKTGGGPVRSFKRPAPPPMGAAGRSATSSRQAGDGLGAIRQRRNSTVDTSTAAGGQLRGSRRTEWEDETIVRKQRQADSEKENKRE
ncbi:AGAP013422-PA [Anopheles gambiae str. PEST]|uniref:AGAP013306-PA n=1 Tax=Anopheles gambiae TaxID=7165 RepID=F5HJW9_ANOGA|nr:AGAP013306-PA [Anopheles gambiae str. PEST]EGK96586.1 AGAP013422-PA [Anopheles gambiae str. PEST]